MRATLRRLVRRVWARLGPRTVILLYHRIAEHEGDPYLMCVTPRNFELHLRAIREIGRPVTLREVARGAREGGLPDGAVCVTFDDGYRDNLYAARPLLERHGIPATFFVTTGRGGREREFWWDELERIFLQPGSLPPRLRLRVDGRSVDRELGEAARYTEVDRQHHRAWTLLDAETPTARHAAFRALYELLQPLPGAERTRTMDRLADWAGLPPGVRPTRRALDPEEVSGLAAADLAEVGAHTVDHVALPAEPVAVQREQVIRSKAALERWSGRPAESFAYPYGLYSDESVAAVRDAGFEYACACLGQPVRRYASPFLLPRIDVVDQDGVTFARELRRRVGR